MSQFGEVCPLDSSRLCPITSIVIIITEMLMFTLFSMQVQEDQHCDNIF